MAYAAEGMGSLTPSAAVFSSDFVKEHSSYPTGDPATCQMDNSCAQVITRGNKQPL